jgi:lipid II:glycine glycyltransferase (peptidoglycan interpeptide bridge formation enzyme)
VLTLTEDFATIRAKRFSSNARRHLKIAEAAGLELVGGSEPELVRDFHTLLTRSFDRWAAQQKEPAFVARLRGKRRDPLWKFLAISKALGPQMKIFLARRDGRPVAAILVLFGRNAHYTRGAMDKTLAAPTSANYLLQAAAIEEACRSGCTTYHMGETGRSKSLADFKEKFGAIGVDYWELRHERLPISQIDAALRSAAKKMLGMSDG